MNRLDELIAELKGYVAEGDQYGPAATHPTTIAVRIAIEKAADELARLRDALEVCALGFEKHARHWRASAERTSLIEDRLRAENADALAEQARQAATKIEKDAQ